MIGGRGSALRDGHGKWSVYVLSLKCVFCLVIQQHPLGAVQVHNIAMGQGVNLPEVIQG